MAGSPIFRRITLTEVKKTSNKRGSLLKELARLENEEQDIIKNHHDPSYSNWRASFLIEDGMDTSGFMQTTLSGQGDTNLETIEGNVEASYQAYEGGSDALSNTAITSSGTGSGTDGGFDLGKDYLGFNGNSTPRYAALKPIDASKFDTLVVTGIRGNDSNGGEDPDAADEDLMVYYQLPGENTIHRLDYSGGVQQSGVEYKIIPVGSGDGTLKDWTLALPSYARSENIRFILYQPTHHGVGFDNYGVTQINYRRTSPLTVFVSLDSPEASAFIRVGSPSKASQSKKQREKQLREQLEASKDYTDKKFGENFPGSTTPAPGEEDPTEQEKRAPGIGEFEPEVVDYNTWKQETEEENPQAKTSEAEYQKYVDTIEKEKSFAALRSDQKPEADPEIKTDPEGKVDFNDFKQIQIKKEVTKLNTAITTEIKDGDNKSALKDVDKILKVQPDNAEAKLMKSTVERRLGDTESANKDQSAGLVNYLNNPDWNLPELEAKTPAQIESQQKTESDALVQGLIDGDEEIISELKPEEQEAYRKFMQKLKDEGGNLSQLMSTVQAAGLTFKDYLLHNAGIRTYTTEDPRVIKLPTQDAQDIKNTINNYLNQNVDPKDWSNLPQKDLDAINNLLLGGPNRDQPSPSNIYGPEGGLVRDEYYNTIGQIGSPSAFANHINVDKDGNLYINGISDTYTFTDPKDAVFGVADQAIQLTSGINPNMDTDYEYTLNSGEKIPVSNMPVQVNFDQNVPNFNLGSSINQVISNPNSVDQIAQLSNALPDQVQDVLSDVKDKLPEVITSMVDAANPIGGILPRDVGTTITNSLVNAVANPLWTIATSTLTNNPLDLSALVPPETAQQYGAELNVSWFDGTAMGANGEPIQIPIVSTPQNYSDENIVVDSDGRVTANDGTFPDRTGFDIRTGITHDNKPSGTHNQLALAGQSQLQVVIPRDGSEPYVLYTDHAYHNRDQPGPGEEGYTGEVSHGVIQTASNIIDGLSNLLHGRIPGSDNTGGMAGYPSNIRGDVVKQTKIPLESLPLESQEYIKNSSAYQNRDNAGVQTHYDNLDKEPPGSPANWEYLSNEQKVEWLDNNIEDLAAESPMELEEPNELSPEEMAELSPEEQAAAELTPLEHQDLETQLMTIYKENPEYLDQVFDDYYSSPEQEEYMQETGDLYKLIKKEKSEAYDKWSKEKNAKADKLWDEYTKWSDEYKALARKEYDEYFKTQYWHEYPEYLKEYEPYMKFTNSVQSAAFAGTLTRAQQREWDRLGDKFVAASKAAQAKAAKAKKDYFDYASARDKEHYAQSAKLREEYTDARVIKKGEYDEYLAKNPNHNKKEQEAQKKLDSMIAANTIRMDAFMMDVIAEYNAGQNYGPPQGWPTDPDEYQDFDVSQTDQLIASAATDAQELRWILNSGIPLTEKQRNDLIDKINGLKKSDVGLSPFPGDIASDADTSLGVQPGDELAWGTKKPKGPPTTKTRRGATDAHAASTGMYPSMTPEKFKEKYGMSYNDYLKLPQFGQQSSSSGSTSGTRIAASPNSPDPVKPKDVPTAPSSPYLPGKSPYQAKRIVPQKDFGSVADIYGGQGVDASTLASVASQTQKGRGVKPKKKKLSRTPVTASYRPNGSLIIEKKQLKSPNQFFNQDDIKPDYPKDPPPEMVNNYHPNLADGEKVSQRFNKLDPASAKAMPKTGNPHIDAKVEKAKNNPDKDGPAWHKKVSDKIRKARAQQRTGTGQSNGDDSNGDGGEG